MPASVVVPTLMPLAIFHLLDPAKVALTWCGLPVHGWYRITEEQARNNANPPCRRCFLTLICEIAPANR